VRQIGSPPDPAYVSACELAPWDTVCEILNYVLSQFGPIDAKAIQEARTDAVSPWSEAIRQADPVTLPEDLQMHGFSWAHHYLRDDRFNVEITNTDPFNVSETEEHRNVRMTRVVGLGIFLAERLEYVSYHEKNHRFSAKIRSLASLEHKSLASRVLYSGRPDLLCDIIMSDVGKRTGNGGRNQEIS
jgi:hypothetical protein